MMKHLLIAFLFFLPLIALGQEPVVKAAIIGDETVMQGFIYQSYVEIPIKGKEVVLHEISSGTLQFKNDSIFVEIYAAEEGIHLYEGYVKLRTKEGDIEKYTFSSAFFSLAPAFAVGSTTLVKGVKNTVYINQYPQLLGEIIVKVDNGEAIPTAKDKYSYTVIPARQGKLTLTIYEPTGQRKLASFAFDVYSL